MNKTIKGLLSLGLAVALATAPLIACDDDDGAGNGAGKLSGVAVTEQQWKDYISNTVNSKNFTETHNAESGELYMHNTYQFDLDNGYVNIKYDDNTGKYGHIDAYFIRDKDNSELWWIAYNDKSKDNGFVCNQTIAVQSGRLVFDSLEFSGWYSGLRSWLDWQSDEDVIIHELHPYFRYAKFTYDNTDGSYFEKYDESTNRGLSEKRLYFKDGYCIGLTATIQGIFFTMSCSDIDTTSITVPSEVTSSIQKYKDTNPDLPYDFT